MNKLNENYLNSIKDNINKRINNIYMKTNKLKPIKDNLIEKFRNLKLKELKKNHLVPTIIIQNLQDKVVSILKNDSYNVLLKQSQFYTKTITWVLMGTAAFAVGWISVAKTDEVVIATGKLEPIGGVIDVQMPLEGVAREILIKDGVKNFSEIVGQK